MSSRTANQERALGWYIQTKKLRVQLSQHPTYYFLNARGGELTEHIDNIVQSWNRFRKEEKRLSKGGRR